MTGFLIAKFLQRAIIGEEGREAYNSLIERKPSLGAGLGMGISPAATLLRHLDTNEFELATAKTLPRRSMHLHERIEPARGITCRDNGEQIVVPLHNAPRPMTLPTRGAAGRAKKLDASTGARMVNGGSANESAEQTVTSPTCNGDGNGGSSPCESPSYLTNTFYKFPESANANVNTNTPAAAATTPTDETTNPIPLPPRDGKKHIKTHAKRHVRKYPLIIPVNGLQRTLNMVTETTPMDDGIKPVTALTLSNGVMQSVLTTPQSVQLKATPNNAAATEPPEEVSATVAVNAPPRHTYQNMNKSTDAESGSAANTTDSASLHFESILEADYDKGNVLQSPDVTDGFYNFSIQKEQYNKGKDVDFDTNKIDGLYDDELRNLDIEKNLKLQENSVVVKVATVAAASTNPAEHAPAPTVTKPVSAVAVLTTTTTTTTPTTTTTNTTTETKTKPCVVTTATITLASPAAEAIPTPKVATTAAPETAIIREKSGKSNPTADNELAGNALFKKVRESVDLAMDKKAPGTTATATSSAGSNSSNKVQKVARASSIATTTTRPQTETEYFAAATARLKDSNSVSCEDLLEFSDKKPKGCERGVDSDEVRIMVKVLGKNVVEPTRCLQSLEFIGWDVHKAIKIIKLQNILPAKELSLATAVEALQKFEWDLHTTALKLKTNKC